MMNEKVKNELVKEIRKEILSVLRLSELECNYNKHIYNLKMIEKLTEKHGYCYNELYSKAMQLIRENHTLL